MANPETPQNGHDQQSEPSPEARPTDAAARTGEPPGYDTDKEDYAGISSGALHTIEGLHDARDFAEMIVDTIREGLLVLGFDLRVVAVNESFYDQFEVRPEETVGRLVYDLGDGQWDIPELRELLENILPHEEAFNAYEVDHDFEGLGRRQMLLNARRLNDHQLILLAIEDVTERRKGERELRDLNQRLADLNRTLEERVEERTRQVRELSRSLTLAEQEERQRIAHVLHDDLQQVLVGTQMVAEDAGQVRALLTEAIEITRALSHELSPPLLQEDNLEVLLRWLAERKRKRLGLEVEVEVRGDVPVPEGDLRILVYQIVRELLFNVAKHAGTKRARVVAERRSSGSDHHVRVVVEDEGAGFDPATLEEASNVGLGLPSVRERLKLVGGRLDVDSTPGEGTRVTMEVPLRPE